MRGSLNLGRLFGIRVSIHWTFSLLIIWIVTISISRGMDTIQILMQILFILSLFVCVVLHEFGHSLVAIKLGGEVNSITLLPIGGMAHMARMPEKPKEEFLVSAAGPLVNIFIAGLLWVYLAVFQTTDWQQMDFEVITGRNFAFMLLAANLFIVAFNLIPAFPMDGGRLFRSALAIKMNRIKATEIAKNIGQVFAVFFILAGLFINPFLVIIGIFILLGAKGEYEMIKYQDVLNNYSVTDILKKEYATLGLEDTLGTAADKLVQISDNGFVILSEGQYKGILDKNDLIKGLNLLGKQGKIKEVIRWDIQAVNKEKPLFDVYQEMQKSHNRILPVFSGEQFLGILDIENIHELFMIREALQK